MTSEFDIQANLLEKEANLYSQYLIDQKPPQEMIKRYIDANRILNINRGSSLDNKVVQFSVSYPRSIPLLDAAAGFLQRDSLLRKKIYTMAAVLETSPKYTKEFLPRHLSSLRLFVQLCANGLATCIKVLIGIPLFLFVKRGTRD